MQNPKAYAITSKDEKVLMKSSSGGVFYHVASYYLNNLHGVVFGATIDNGVVYHKRIDTTQYLDPLLKSKYVKSDLRFTFKECATDLQNGLNVFYIGTPCQIGALKNYLSLKNINTDKLLTADIICHGVPSPFFWDMYKREISGKETVKNIDFRNKKRCWEEFMFSYDTEKKSISQMYNRNPYMVAFLKNYILMESCFNCAFKGENRKSDFTIGDFWGVEKYYPELYNKKGVSLIVIRNKVDYLLNILNEETQVFEVKYSVILDINPPYFQSAQKCDDHEFVIKKINERGILNVFKYRKNKSIKQTIKQLIKSFFIILLKDRKKVNLSKKTVIITDYGFNNYGNRLQNYALRQVLKSINIDSVNLYFAKNAYLFPPALRLKANNSSTFKNFRRNYNIYKASKKSHDIEICYNYSPYIKKQIKTVNNVIVGSDQIWNWTYHTNDLPFCLAIFCANEKVNKISYAASIGTNHIDNNHLFSFKEGLKDYNAVGVRESNAIDILSCLKLKPVHLLDPTLLLNAKEWEEAVKKYKTKNVPAERYILKYCLKCDNETTITKCFKEYPIIDILDSENSFFTCNQFDFINLISHSSLVISDSFHAFVFSLIFKKKIVLFFRNEMLTRFQSIFDLLGINFCENSIIDLSTADTSKIQFMIEKSILFLKNNLKR